MPAGRPASIARNLLRNLGIDSVRHVVDYYDLPRARSIEDMIDAIVRKVGTDLSTLVSNEGPFTLDAWNEIIDDIGGHPRRSFEAAREEIAYRLDRVVLEF